MNFTERQAQQIASAGFNVERGFIGQFEENLKRCEFWSPHPLYEYDIMFYNSEFPGALRGEFPRSINLLDERGSVDALGNLATPPKVRVSFVGGWAGTEFLLQGGAPFINLAPADTNVSAFVEPEPTAFAIEEIHRLVQSFRNAITSVSYFLQRKIDAHPFWHVPVLHSRAGEEVAGYGRAYEDHFPRYIVLPQLKDIPRAAVQILQCLEVVAPDLFPDRSKRDWLNSDEFLLPEEKRINEIIQQRIAETTAFIEAKEQEKQSIVAQNAYIRQLLIATEHPKLPMEQRLSSVVKRALEFLEFQVTDIDQKLKGAIKKEDFWVVDGNFFAITEVTGTTNKNPKVKEYNDILGRMTTIYKRKGELAVLDGRNASGLLVLNYDIDNHPTKRPRVYTGEDEHIVEAAIEQEIGLLSTVELHKVIVAVKENILTKAEAREILKRSGRIEFDARRHKEVSTSK